LARISLEHLAVVTNAAQADVTRLGLRCKGWQDIRFIVELGGRNTAPVDGLAAAWLGAEEPTGPDGGVSGGPLYPGSGEPGGRPGSGRPLDEAGRGFRATRFIEKPDLARARAFLAEGGYSWNSGIFLFRRDVLLAAMARHLPEVYQTGSPLPGCEPGSPGRSLPEFPQYLPGSRHHGAG